MSSKQTFGAGIWHFATYVDRYATDGYGPPRGLIEMIDMAGQVDDLTVVDINYPFADTSVSLDDVEEALQRNKLSIIGITPEIYTQQFAKGAFTNPDPGIRRLANEMINEGQTGPGIDALRKMTEHFPDYVAAYFKAAQALAESGETDEAREIVKTGIETAGRVGDDHAAREMTEFLQMLNG